jgi:hypothetical protein
MRYDQRALPRRWASLGLAALLLLGAAGCASKGTVTGKIKYQGKPLGGGVVVFSVPDKGSVRAEIGEDGSYRVDKVPRGTATITVETRSLAPTPQQSRLRPGQGPNFKPPLDKMPNDVDKSFYEHAQKQSTYVAIPDTYNDPDKSGLSYDVEPGSHNFDIDLK